MSNFDIRINRAFWATISLTLALCALWNIPHTISIRYLVAMLLIGLVIWEKPNILAFLKNQPVFIAICFYFFFHIFFISDNLALSLKSFNQEWMKFILFSLLGASLGIYFSNKNQKDIFLWIGGAFSVPLIIHLVLFIHKSIESQYIPLGYAGLSISHGDLGYTALQSSIFLSIYILSCKNAILKKTVASFLLFCCALSPYLAQSRGGLIFVIFSTFLVATIFYLSQSKFNKIKKVLITIVITFFICVFSVKIVSVALSDKWVIMSQRIEVGLIGDPVDIICNGPKVIMEDFNLRNISISHELEELINDVNAGTAARLTVARAGIKLLLENPMGLNGAKNAYEIAISTKCDPAIKMANTHNAWLDLALALGFPGLILFLLQFFNYSWMGIKALRTINKSMTSAAIGILSTSITWLLRGVLDATSRDQMLEMQAFCLALLAGMLFFKSSKMKE